MFLDLSAAIRRDGFIWLNSTERRKRAVAKKKRRGKQRSAKQTHGRKRKASEHRHPAVPISPPPKKERTGLHITIGTYPSGDLSLEHDIRLVKAALLYADSVELYSFTSTFFLHMLPRFASFNMTNQLKLLENTIPYMSPEKDGPGLLAFAKWFRGSRHRHLSRDQHIVRQEMQKGVKQFVAQIRAVADELATKAKVRDVERAVQSGVLELHRFKFEGANDDDILIEFMTDCIAGAAGSPQLASRKPAMSKRNDKATNEFAGALFDTVTDGTTHPLFDEPTSDLVQAAIREGWISPSESTIGRGKHSALAGHLLSRLPLFDLAPVDEILDIRKAGLYPF